MKNPILRISFIILIVGFSYCIYEIAASSSNFNQDGHKHNIHKQDCSEIYFIDLPVGLDTLDFSASITINKRKRFHKIQFPTNGTATTILINDSAYLTKITKKIKTIPLVSGSFKLNQNALLEISDLKPGKYYVHYMSCNLGGIFPLTIE